MITRTLLPSPQPSLLEEHIAATMVEEPLALPSLDRQRRFLMDQHSGRSCFLVGVYWLVSRWGRSCVSSGRSYLSPVGLNFANLSNFKAQWRVSMWGISLVSHREGDRSSGREVMALLLYVNDLVLIWMVSCANDWKGLSLLLTHWEHITKDMLTGLVSIRLFFWYL